MNTGLPRHTTVIAWPTSTPTGRPRWSPGRGVGGRIHLIDERPSDARRPTAVIPVGYWRKSRRLLPAWASANSIPFDRRDRLRRTMKEPPQSHCDTPSRVSIRLFAAWSRVLHRLEIPGPSGFGKRKSRAPCGVMSPCSANTGAILRLGACMGVAVDISNVRFRPYRRQNGAPDGLLTGWNGAGTLVVGVPGAAARPGGIVDHRRRGGLDRSLCALRYLLMAAKAPAFRPPFMTPSTPGSPS